MARVEIKTNAQLHHMSRAGIITSRALDGGGCGCKARSEYRQSSIKFSSSSLEEQGGISNFYG